MFILLEEARICVLNKNIPINVTYALPALNGYRVSKDIWACILNKQLVKTCLGKYNTPMFWIVKYRIIPNN